MTENNPNHNSSIEELCLSMYTGKGSEGIDNIDTYLVAERTLHGMINEAMLGKGESAEEMIEYINLMLIETSQGYARSVMTVKDQEEIYQFAAVLLHHSLLDIQDLVKSHQCDIPIETSNVDDIAEAFMEQAEDEELPEELSKMFEETYGAIHQDIINEMLSCAPYNENDLRRERRAELKANLFDIAKDATKVALGATAAVVALRFLDHKS